MILHHLHLISSDKKSGVFWGFFSDKIAENGVIRLKVSGNTASRLSTSDFIIVPRVLIISSSKMVKISLDKKSLPIGS